MDDDSNDGSEPPSSSGPFGSRGASSRLERMQQRELCKRLGLVVPPPEYFHRRYRLDTLLGRGGMGEVYLAWDEQLRREVALKLVVPSDGSVADRLAARLVSEAQALAKLDSQYVVAVHEMGVDEGETYITMAFVRGTTLRRWQQGRSAKEILAKYIDAARGLADAHAHHIVHRDFKADNVLVGDDGKVRVADFGIAGAIREHDTRPTQDAATRDGAPSTFDDDDDDAVGVAPTILTRTRGPMGTLPYMSPEQLAAKSIDARSDQFSYCVALWQALTGTHPFPVTDALSREQAMQQAPKDADKLPAWLRPILARGLAFEPERRWADMQALIDALLAHDRRIRNRRIGAGGGVAFLGAVVLGYVITPKHESCDTFVDLVDAHWDDARAEALTAKLAKLDRRAATSLVAELGHLVSQWQTDAQGTCQDGHAPAQDSDRRRCMTQWMADFDRIVETLDGIDVSRLAKAPELVARLAPIGDDYCAIQPRQDIAPEVVDPAKRAREAAVLGDFETARIQAQAAIAAADVLPSASKRYSAERAEALAANGHVLAFASGDLSATLERLEVAQAHARATGYSALELDVVIMRAKQAVLAHKLELAAGLLEQLDPLAELLRLGPDDPRRGEIHEAWGIYERERGNFDAAIEHHRRSREIFDRAGRPLDAAKAVQNQGICQWSIERYADAKASYEQALRIYQAAGISVPKEDAVGVPVLRNYIEVELCLGLLALELGEVGGISHFDVVARHGAPAQQLNAMAHAIGLEEEHGEHSRAVERAERALTLLDTGLGVGTEAPMNTRLAAGAVIGTDDPPRGRVLLEQALRDSAGLDLESQFAALQTYIVFLREHGYCDALDAQFEVLTKLCVDPQSEQLGIAAWRDEQRVVPCDTQDRLTN
jgi:tetratricopeptide (TPR) repeat protein/predicted Ser/Thr protein kinase